MTIVLIGATTVLMIVGLAGTIIPALPGTLIIFAGAMVYALGTDFARVGVDTIWILGIITAATIILDYVASAYGAKKFGSTKYGIWGSVIGGIVGMLLLNVIGLILGIFCGAVFAEMYYAGKSKEHALRIGWGSILGFLGGTIIKVILGVVMIGIFLDAVLMG